MAVLRRGCVVITIQAAINAWWALASWLLLTNVVANLYPIMLQRHNRARLLPVLEKLGPGIAGKTTPSGSSGLRGQVARDVCEGSTLVDSSHGLARTPDKYLPELGGIAVD